MGVQTVEKAINVDQESPQHPAKDPAPLDNANVSCETVDINSDTDDGTFDEMGCEDQREAYLGGRRIRDSMEVQERLGKVNDDELHEENPHLEDYLIPHHRHIESLDITSETGGETAAEDECCAGGTTTTDEELSIEKEESVRSDLITEVAEAAATEPQEHEGPSQCPARVLVPADGCEVVNSSDEIQPASLPGMDEPYKPSKLKTKLRFGTVLVRDYDMILGDNPCCSYGPPVTIGWDYLEYNPIDVNEYEFHRPPRRSIREMGLNYYQRKDLLRNAGYMEEDFKMSKKEVGRAKLNRNITRSVVSHYPLWKAEDAVESARRKFKRLIKEDHWKQQKSLFVK